MGIAAIPIKIHKGNKRADFEKFLIEKNIKLLQHKMPSIGNQGENGTLNGLGLSGSVCLSIKTATHTIINDVNVPKLHNSAATFKFKVKTPIIAHKATV